MLSKRQRVLLNPISAIFFVSFISVFFNLYFLDGALSKGLLVYLYGVLCFCFGCALVFLFMLNFKVKKNKLFEFNPAFILKLYWLLAFLSLVLSLYRMYSVGLNGQLGSFFLNLRYEHIVIGSSSYGAQHFGLFSLALGLYYGIKGDFVKSFFSSLIYFLSAISLAERTSIFFLFISMFYMLYYKGYVNLKLVAVFFLLLIFLFIVIAVGSGRVTGNTDYQFLYDYLGYGITNFDYYIYSRSYEGCGEPIFGVFYKLLQIDKTGCDAVRGLFTVQDRFNVYTYVAAPYLYGGWPGVTVIMIIVGAFYAFLWEMARIKGGYFIVLLSIYMYALFMVFYAWQFSLTTYIYMIFILFPLFFKFKIIRVKN